ncbi:MAG: thermonuclease family protein [Acidobacteria bacterium]|nr:thermonuclease family protein [Acidobacteriota bacterium]
MVRTPLNYLAGAGVLLAIAAGGAYYASQSASAASVAGEGEALTVYWSDGDSGRLSDGTKFRLHGIDSPETGSMKQRGGAKCEGERALGFEAKEAALELTRGKTVRVSERFGADRYDRLVVSLEINGRDVAAQLVSGGTHQTWDYDGRQKKPDWCGEASS